jgi:type III secretion protein L
MSQAKQASLDDLPTGPGVRILRAARADAWQDGYRFLAEASQTAEQIKRAARDVYSTERTRGYADGRAEGAQEATRLVTETAAKVDRYLATLDLEVARLVIDIVRRILGEFDAVDLVSRAAMQAITDFRREKALKITVHPEVLERVRAALPAALSDGSLGPSVTIESDPHLGKQACVVSTEFAVVDASVETQLSAIADALGVGPSSLRGTGP